MIDPCFVVQYELCVCPSSFAITLMGKKDLVVLLEMAF